MKIQKKLLISPWDFCLYNIDENIFLLEVVFIEGVYKVEMSKYYIFQDDKITNAIVSSVNLLSDMRNLSASIREDEYNYSQYEIRKSEFNKLKG